MGRLVTGEGRKDISSPVGIVQGSSDAAKEGTESFLFVLGLISLSIALLNLLPLLPLDGGHIVFAIAEGISGRAVRREIYERVSVVGIGIVLLLFALLADAVAELHAGLAHFPDDVPLLNLLALTLATAPDAQVRNAVEAVRLAERACALGPPGSPELQATLETARRAAAQAP